MNDQTILLESGTNEAEFLEFYLDKQSFAINVAKVQTVQQYDSSRLTRLPKAPEAVCGTYLYRERTVPLISLTTELKLRPKNSSGPELQIVIIAEFNNVLNAFLVDGVERIHRIGWNQIQPLGHMLSENDTRLTGVLTVQGRDILMVDVEAIVADIFPSSAFKDVEPYDENHSDTTILIVEDSRCIRSMIVNALEKAGYPSIISCEDGLEAWEFLSRFEDDETCLPKIILSDIEMPRMDGLTLCRKVKANSNMSKIPLLFFSSLINDQMAEKCKQVGADGYMSKPEIGKILDQINSHCFKGNDVSNGQG